MNGAPMLLSVVGQEGAGAGALARILLTQGSYLAAAVFFILGLSVLRSAS